MFTPFLHIPSILSLFEDDKSPNRPSNPPDTTLTAPH
jgi:hypothetical protein